PAGRARGPRPDGHPARDRASRERPRRPPGRRRHPRSEDALGERVAGGSAVVLVAARAGATRGTRDGRRPRARPPARVRPRAALLVRRGIASPRSRDLAALAARPLGRAPRSPGGVTLRTAGRVAWIHVAPVKGMALVALDTADLTATGIDVDRRFCVLDPAGRIQNGKVAGPLVRIAPDYDAGAGMLALRFPDGTVVRAPVDVGEPVLATFSGRPRDARLVRGPWAEAVSEWAGRPFRIARFDGHGR